jgi:hypothetical protein
MPMWNSWWLVWMLFMLMFMVTPVGYGWGYRRWGPPYPSYFQRRREQRAAAAGGVSPAFDHYAWGFVGDYVWLITLVGLFWVAWALMAG